MRTTRNDRVRAELEEVKEELVRHRQLLSAAQEEARQHGVELASLERLARTQQLKECRSAQARRDDARTIKQLAVTMAEQQDTASTLETQHQETAARADRLQDAVTASTLAAREREELLALVLNVSVDGVLVYRALQGADGSITDFECVLHNPAARMIYGTDGLAGRRLLELHPDIQAKGLWKQYVSVMETGKPFEGEYRYGREAQRRWFRVLAVKLASGIAVMFSDISQRKQLEAQILAQLEELQHADQMKNQFLGIISHELRTPINAIMGFASILEDEIPGTLNEAQRSYVGKISAGSDLLLGLVENLLDMSRLQAGKLGVTKRPCAIAPLIADVLSILEPLVGPRVLVTQAPADLPLVMADERRVKQVLTNLVANAIKFTPDGGTITVRARVANGFMHSEVSDTGVGISAESLPKLFQIFVQVDMSPTRPAGGTGLGLAISRGLVEAHGGTMGVESKEGRGSTFWFTLPLAPTDGSG